MKISLFLFAEAKCIACSYECKFIETSAAISHQVDELLVGIVTQIRLKSEQQVERKAFEGQGLAKKRPLSRLERRASSIIGRLLGKGKLKSQSCGNLHVL